MRHDPTAFRIFDTVLIATLLAPKVKCTTWLGTAQLVFYDCFCSKDGVKLGLDSVIVLLTLDITVNYVNGAVKVA